jgi:hypothetical protein
VGYYQMGDYYRRGGPITALARAGKAILPYAGRALGAAATAGTIYEAFKGITAPSAAAAAVPAGVAPGRSYRHMNVCNVRALRRSLRRVAGFAKVARKVMVFARPRKGTHFKLPRRKKR